MKYIHSYLFLLIACCVLLISCEQKSNTPITSDNQEASKPKDKVNAGNKPTRSNAESMLNKLKKFHVDELTKEREDLIRELATIDPFQALSELIKLPTHSELYHDLKFVNTLAQKNPNVVSDWLRNVEVTSENKNTGSFICNVGEALAKSNPKLALQSVYNSDMKFADSLMKRILLTISVDDAVKAVSLVREIYGENSKFNFVAHATILMPHIVKDPSYAYNLIKEHRLPNSEKLIPLVLSNWVERDPLAVEKVFAEISSKARLSCLKSEIIMTAMLTKNADLVIETMLNEPITQNNKSTYDSLVRNLIGIDFQKAIEFVENLPNGKAKDDILASAYSKYAKDNFEKSFESVSKYGYEANPILYDAVLIELARKDFTKAISMVNDNNGNNKSALLKNLSIKLVQNSKIDEAKKILDDSDLSSSLSMDFKQQMTSAVTKRMAENDVNSALSWIDKMPGDLRVNGTQGLVAAWMKTDPIAASEWLSKQPAGPARDAGAQEIINQIKDTDPEMAEQWRKSMTPK